MKNNAVKILPHHLFLENLALKELKKKQEQEISELNTINIELTKYLNNKTDELNVYEHLAAHEIKSNLRYISTFVNSIRRDHLINKSIDNHLNHIDYSLEKMDNLLTNVLKYTNLSKEINQKNIDLNKVLKNIIKLIDNPNKAAIKVPGKFPVINFNRKAIEQIFVYLISNALNNANKECGIVEIDFKDCPTYFLFIITDNGLEVEEHDYGNIFNLLNSIDSDDKNSGISLSIVRKIVELHGGKIWNHYKKNQGTSFYFSIAK